MHYHDCLFRFDFEHRSLDTLDLCHNLHVLVLLFPPRDIVNASSAFPYGVEISMRCGKTR